MFATISLPDIKAGNYWDATPMAFDVNGNDPVLTSVEINFESTSRVKFKLSSVGGDITIGTGGNFVINAQNAFNHLAGDYTGEMTLVFGGGKKKTFYKVILKVT